MNYFPRSLSSEPPNDGKPVNSVSELFSSSKNSLSNLSNRVESLLEGVTIPKTWEKVFEDREDLASVFEFLENFPIDSKSGYRYFPKKCDIFRALELCPSDSVRVVIFGQDPYHSLEPDGNPTAVGLAFSVRSNAKIPSSLSNIFRELKREYSDFEFSSGNLTKWAKQGVLLLNTCLTVVPYRPKSHGSIWMNFILKIISVVSEKNPNVIWVLWGKDAQSMKRHLPPRNISLETSHPSGYSANRGFLGCGHFSKINEILVSLSSNPIDWNLKETKPNWDSNVEVVEIDL
jgi:uracil-DNA glycosylase